MNSQSGYLPGRDFSCNSSASINSQGVCFFSLSWADETIFKCEHCNRTGLPTHTQDLEGAGFRYTSEISLQKLVFSMVRVGVVLDVDWPYCEW